MSNLKLATLVLLGACSPSVITLPHGATADGETPGQLAITGTATLEVTPDCADLSMTLSSDDLGPGAATAHVDAKEQAVVSALAKLGVPATDIKLSLVTLEPIYEPSTDSWLQMQLKVHTYRAQITITATTHDFTKISAIMEAGADGGATALSSQFRRSDLPALKKQVREMALTAAKDKAQQTASALDLRLGRIVSVPETAGGSMWSGAYFPQNTPNQAATNGGSSPLGGTLQPLTLEVSIGYELPREI